MYNSSDFVVQNFINLINSYFILWTDQEFANLSMKNWIKISLKFDWKTKITNKNKIYFMNTKNREVLDNTIDKFHKHKQLF